MVSHERFPSLMSIFSCLHGESGLYTSLGGGIDDMQLQHQIQLLRGPFITMSGESVRSVKESGCRSLYTTPSPFVLERSSGSTPFLSVLAAGKCDGEGGR